MDWKIISVTEMIIMPEVWYIEETGEVTMVNLVTGEQKIVNSTDRS